MPKIQAKDFVFDQSHYKRFSLCSRALSYIGAMYRVANVVCRPPITHQKPYRRPVPCYTPLTHQCLTRIPPRCHEIFLETKYNLSPCASQGYHIRVCSHTSDCLLKCLHLSRSVEILLLEETAPFRFICHRKSGNIISQRPKYCLPAVLPAHAFIHYH